MRSFATFLTYKQLTLQCRSPFIHLGSNGSMYFYKPFMKRSFALGSLLFCRVAALCPSIGTAVLPSSPRKAKFKELPGKQTFYYGFLATTPTCMYKLRRDERDLKAILKAGSKSIFAQNILSRQANTLHLVNQKGKEHILTLQGKRAAGFSAFTQEKNYY